MRWRLRKARPDEVLELQPVRRMAALAEDVAVATILDPFTHGDWRDVDIPGWARSIRAFYRMLTPAQQWRAIEERLIFVKGSEGHLFSLRLHTYNLNVKTVPPPSEPRVYTLCAYPAVLSRAPWGTPLPIGDCWLAQKLWLEADERGFVRQTQMGRPGSDAFWESMLPYLQAVDDIDAVNLGV